MNLWGVEIPSVAVAIGSIIGAFLIGFGAGLGSEVGKYVYQKYLAKGFHHIKKGIKKIKRVNL